MTKKIQKYRNTSLRQQEIMDATGSVLVKYGSKHLTIRKIAEEVGIAEGTIYKHFRSKREILSSMVDNIGDLLTSDIEGNRTKNQSPMEILCNTIRNQFSAIQQSKGTDFYVIAEICSLGDEQLKKKVNDNINKYTGLMRDLLSEGMKKGEIQKDVDLDTVASLIFNTMEGLTCHWIMDNHSFNLEQRGEILFRFIFEKIRKH